MRNDMPSSRFRAGLRALAMLPGGLILLGALPALAEPPKSWDNSAGVSALHALLLLLGVPALLFVVISVLVALPSIIHGQKYDAALAFREQPEWFGDPRKGADAAPPAPDDGTERGGSGAHW